MLSEVRVRDFALLEAVEIELDDGLNVISGATGEGKSLLLSAIGLLLGGRAKKGLVREGADHAVIEGLFTITPGRLEGLTDLVQADADEIVLRRVIGTDGKSKAYIDGHLCSAGLLERIGGELVDVHGQRNTLLRPAEQRLILDRLAGTEDLHARWQTAHRELTECLARRDGQSEAEADRLERLDFLRFQLKDLDALDPQPGEEASLETELRRLADSVHLRAALSAIADDLLEADGAMTDVCARRARDLDDLIHEDAELEGLRDRLQALRIEAEELGREAGALASGALADPARLAEVEDRLAALRAQARRHRITVDELPARRDRMREQIAALELEIHDPEVVARRIGELSDDLRAIGKDLLSKRGRAAKKVEKAVHEGLAELLMPRARVRFEVGPSRLPTNFEPAGAGPDGPYPVRMLVATNPGLPEAPLDEVASGGEMARVMLALKGALAGVHRRPLLIFDEIDAGIGARVGLPFGRRIAAIAREHQVLVVTHLPQVAAFAQRHFRVIKTVGERQTETSVVPLSKKERVVELADMLGAGTAPAARTAARQQARALMDEAEG